MTTPKASATAARIQRLREHIAQAQARLRRERRKQRAHESTVRAQRLRTYGELVALAALDHEDPAVVLGLLLEGMPRTQDPATRQQWQVTGAQYLRGTIQEREPLSPLLPRGSAPVAPSSELPQSNINDGSDAASCERECRSSSPAAAQSTRGNPLQLLEYPGIVSGQM
jgi:hypothetical protein